MNKKLLTSLFTIMMSLIAFCPLHAQYEENLCCEECDTVNGKLDLGAAYVHVDVLLSGHTIHRMDMGGVRWDANYRIWKGLVVKPTVLYAHGNKKDRVITGGVGFGFCLPYKECFCFTPTAGINWGYLKTSLQFRLSGQHPLTGQEFHLKTEISEKFRSISPYIGLEFSYTFCPTWRIVANYQYSWSYTRTTVGNNITLGREKQTTRDHSQGSSYNLLVEHDLTKEWSVNFGAAYNCSLSKEKHGIRAYGFKLGVAYWF